MPEGRTNKMVDMQLNEILMFILFDKCASLVFIWTNDTDCLCVQ
jgi:hypothetical protein